MDDGDNPSSPELGICPDFSDDALDSDTDLDPGNSLFSIIQDMGFTPGEILSTGLRISSNGRNSIRACEVRDTLMMPEYPETTFGGVATFIHCQKPLIEPDSRPLEVMSAFKKINETIQFSTHRKASGTASMKTTSLKFLSADRNLCRSYHKTLLCSGVKLCGHADPHMRDPCEEFDRPTAHFFEQYLNQQGAYNEESIDDMVRQLTEHFYFAVHHMMRKHPCVGGDCAESKPEMFVQDEKLMFGCAKLLTSQGHSAWPVKTEQFRGDVQYLFDLGKYGAPKIQDQCKWVGQANTRRKFCGLNHSQDWKQVEQVDCEVRWDIYIPYHMARFPFVIIVGNGTHSHHPPLPSKVPKEIIKDIAQLIRDMSPLTLTTRRLTQTYLPRAFREKYAGADSLRAIHPGLNIEDRLALLIRKERLAMFPDGCSLAGVVREQQLEQGIDKEKRWIQKIVYHDKSRGHWFIICCTHAMAMRFSRQSFLQMDLSYKMVQGKVMVFSIAGFDQEHQMIDVYAYVFMNKVGALIYEQMFKETFGTLGDLSGQLVNWGHIHNIGIRTVTCDMDGSQAKGLGQYLWSLDKGRTWDEHLQYQLVFCQVHVKRAFRKATRDPKAGEQLDTVLASETKQQYLEGVVRICAAYPDELKTWFHGKRVDWVRAALVPRTSHIPGIYLSYARRETNIIEASHAEDNNAAGRKQSLLGAILGLRSHCRNKDGKRQTAITSGILPTNRPNTQQKRFQRSLYRYQRASGNPPTARQSSVATSSADAGHMPDFISISSSRPTSPSPSVASQDAEISSTPPPPTPGICPTPLSRKRSRALTLEAKVAQGRHAAHLTSMASKRELREQLVQRMLALEQEGADKEEAERADKENEDLLARVEALERQRAQREHGRGIGGA